MAESGGKYWTAADELAARAHHADGSRGNIVQGNPEPQKSVDLIRPSSPLPTDAVERKRTPVWSGFVKYFPRAIVAIAKVSFAGNEQHNPGQPLHWAKEKSRDHLDTAFRHLIDHLFNPVDTDGQLHLAKAGWRINAALETYLEEQDARNQVSRS